MAIEDCIFLYTAQHTGTITTWELLKTHSRIHPVSLEAVDSVIIDTLSKKGNSNLKYLLHSHVWDGDYVYQLITSNDLVKVVITIRDPIKAIISTLGRDVEWQHISTIILEGLYKQSKLDNVFYLPIDMPEHRVQNAHNMFQYLNLDVEPSCDNFIDRWCTYNPTLPVGSPDLLQWWIVKENYNVGQIDDILMPLMPLVEQLSSFYISLGYKDLVWL